jgi:hypothetical protein
MRNLEFYFVSTRISQLLTLQFPNVHPPSPLIIAHHHSTMAEYRQLYLPVIPPLLSWSLYTIPTIITIIFLLCIFIRNARFTFLRHGACCCSKHNGHFGHLHDSMARSYTFGGTYGPFGICQNYPNHRIKTNQALNFNTVYRCINTVVRTYTFSHVWGPSDIKKCKYVVSAVTHNSRIVHDCTSSMSLHPFH